MKLIFLDCGRKPTHASWQRENSSRNGIRNHLVVRRNLLYYNFLKKTTPPRKVEEPPKRHVWNNTVLGTQCESSWTTQRIYWCHAIAQSHPGSHLITLPLCQASITETWQRAQSGCNPSISLEITPELCGIASSLPAGEHSHVCRSEQSTSVFWENTHSFRVPISSWKYVVCMKSTAALCFRSNTLNKLLMIKQIETVRNNSLHSWWMAPHIRNSWVMRLQSLFHYSI